MMRPQRVRSMGKVSGCVTRKKPFSDTSITWCHCAGFMPGNTASSWMPALLTTICTGPPASTRAMASAVALSLVMSNRQHSALPPCAAISAASVCKASGREWPCSSTCAPSAANRRAMAEPNAPLAPVISARLPCRGGFMKQPLQRSLKTAGR